MIKVCKLDVQDWALYREIRLDSLQKEPHAFAADYSTNAKRPKEWWMGRLGEAQLDVTKSLLFAKVDEVLVGMVGAYPNNAGETEIIAVYVRPDARGKGVGRQLITAILSEVGGTAFLDVRAVQADAIALYRSCGFTVEREYDAPHPDGSIHRLFRMRRDESLA